MSNPTNPERPDGPRLLAEVRELEGIAWRTAYRRVARETMLSLLEAVVAAKRVAVHEADCENCLDSLDCIAYSEIAGARREAVDAALCTVDEALHPKEASNG